MAVMSYTYETELPPRESQTLKLEINYEEDFSVLEKSEEPFKLDNPWFFGEATVPTFKPDEMMTTKLRALFQRNKGRDLFDLWFAITEGLVDPERILRCFEKYTANLDPPITRARFEKNLSEKFHVGDFDGDVVPLLAPDITYNFNEAVHLVHENLVKNLPGDPYQGDDNIFSEPET